MDAMHDVFVELADHAARLPGGAGSALLYRMATNLCLNRLRAERRRPEDAGDEQLLQIADCRERTGERLLACSFLRRLFQGQPESSRTLAVLHLVDGMTLEEVAREVGLSVSGVRKRLRSLRDRVQGLEEV